MYVRTTMWAMGIAILLSAAISLGPSSEAQQQAQTATIAEECAAAQELLASGNMPAAMPHLRSILELARSSKPDALTGKDSFAIGLAHYYLMAEAFGKALQAGELEPEEAQWARKWRDHALTAAAELAVKVIGQGERVSLSDHAVMGKTTIFDFYSEYCTPCHAIAPLLAKLAQQRPDVVVVKVDINRPGVSGIDWGSPTAQQFGLDSIPHFKIYGPDGKLSAEDIPASNIVREMVTGMAR